MNLSIVSDCIKNIQEENTDWDMQSWKVVTKFLKSKKYNGDGSN